MVLGLVVYVLIQIRNWNLIFDVPKARWLGGFWEAYASLTTGQISACIHSAAYMFHGTGVEVESSSSDILYIFETSKSFTNRHSGKTVKQPTFLYLGDHEISHSNETRQERGQRSRFSVAKGLTSLSRYPVQKHCK